MKIQFVNCMFACGVFTLGAVIARADKVQVGAWMATYYITHDASGFERFWGNTVDKGAFEASPQVRETTIGFLAAFFRQQPEMAKQWLKSVDSFPQKQRDSAKVLLWLIDTDSTRELLKATDPEMLAKHPPAINKRKVYRTSDIDFCVGWFCATGNKEALSPLLEAIKESTWSANDARPDYAVVNLRDIIRRDSSVKAFVQMFLENERLNENARTALKFVLQETSRPKESPRSTQGID